MRRIEIVMGNCSTGGSWTIIPSQRGSIHAPPPGTKTCKTRISVSGQSYNVRTDGFLDVQFYIARDEPFAKSLDDLLKREAWDAIDMAFDDLVMVHATPSLIKAKLAEADREGYDRGYEEKAAEFRQVLGIERGW